MATTTGTWGQGGGSSPIDKYIAQLQTQEEEARLANLNRQQQVEAIWDEIINRYQPGGTFQEQAFGQLEAQKTRDVRREYGKSSQDMISRGLFGTSAMPTEGQVSRKWEEQVGSPERLRLEDVMMQRLSSAQTGKASFLEGIENQYPDYNTMAGLIQSASNRPPVNTVVQGSSKPQSGIGGGYTPTSSQDYSKTGTSIYDDPKYLSSMTPPTTAAPTSSAPDVLNRAYTGGTIMSKGATYNFDSKTGQYVKSGAGVGTGTSQDWAKVEAQLQTKYPQMYDAKGGLKSQYGGAKSTAASRQGRW